MFTTSAPRALLTSKNFSFAALLACVLYAFARGFYLPSAWTLNYYLVNPFDGFYRRALIGAVMYSFGDLRLHYFFVASIQITVSIILLFILLRKIFRIKDGWGFVYTYLCALILSNYGAFFFGITGHPEFVIYLVVLCALSVKSGVLRVLMITSTVWIHEMAVFTALPMYFACEYLYFNRKKTAFGAVALCFVSFVSIYLFFQTVDEEAIIAYKQFFAASNYNVIYHYLEVYQNEFLGSRLKWDTYYGYFPNLAAAWVPLFPLALACILTVGLHDKFGKQFFSTAIIFLSCATPLVMGFFGWDACRWIFMSLVNTSVVYALYAKILGRNANAALLLCAFAGFAFTSIYLFDARGYRTPVQSLQFLLNFKHHVSQIPL